MTGEHRGDGARKAARRKFRHKLLNEQIKVMRAANMSPAAARFHARVAVDVILSQGSTESNAHGRGLVR
jgi:hypothetical protein